MNPTQQQIRTQAPTQNQPQMRPTTPSQTQIRASSTTTNQNQMRVTTANQQTSIRQLNLNQGQVRNLGPSFQTVRQPQSNVLRPTTPGQLRPQVSRTSTQQFRSQNPSASPLRQPNVQVRPGQPRQTAQIGQPRLSHSRNAGSRMTTVNQIHQLQQKTANNQGIDLSELEIVSLSNSIWSISVLKSSYF